jgi:hypothetical protein
MPSRLMNGAASGALAAVVPATAGAWLFFLRPIVRTPLPQWLGAGALMATTLVAACSAAFIQHRRQNGGTRVPPRVLSSAVAGVAIGGTALFVIGIVYVIVFLIWISNFAHLIGY